MTQVMVKYSAFGKFIENKIVSAELMDSYEKFHNGMSVIADLVLKNNGPTAESKALYDSIYAHRKVLAAEDRYLINGNISLTRI